MGILHKCNLDWKVVYQGSLLQETNQIVVVAH